MRNHFQPQNLCDIQNLSKISVSRDDEVHRKVDITLKDPDKEVMYTRGAKTYETFCSIFQNLVLTLEDRDAEEFVLVLQGYFSLLTDRDLSATFIKSSLDEKRKINISNLLYYVRERDKSLEMDIISFSIPLIFLT